MKLKDRVAIVTGGAKGIGWGIVKVLVQEGAKVVVADWDKENGEKTAEEMRQAGGDAIFVFCDVSNEEQVKAMVQKTLDKYGKIDILVNDAGIGVYKSVLDTCSEDWDRCLAVNLKGQFLCAKYCIPHMQAHGQGRHRQHLIGAFLPDRQRRCPILCLQRRHHRPDPQHGDRLRADDPG